MILGLLAAAGWWSGAAVAALPAPVVAALAEAPLDPRAQLGLAAALAAEARDDEAAGIWEAWLGASDPAVAMEARVSLARWLARAPARPALEGLLEGALRGPDLPETADLRARLEALRAAAETRTSGQSERAAVGVQVGAALDGGDLVGALAATRAAVATAPSADARAALLDDLASVLVVSGEAHKRAGDIDGAIADYAVAVSLRPSDAPRIRGLAGLLWQSGHLEGAWALYQRAFALDRDDPATLSAALAVGVAAGHEQEAWALVVLAGPPGPEVEALRRAFERWRGIRDADAAARAGDLAAAEAGFRGLAEAWPVDARIRRGLADALVGVHRYEEALATWREAARLEPLDPWAVLGEANVLVKLGRAADARARLAQGFPADAPAAAVAERRRIEGSAWKEEAERADDAAIAIEAYRQALRFDPDPWVLVDIAFLYLEDGQPERTLAFADEVLARVPGHPGATQARLLALQALGRPAEVLAVLDAGPGGAASSQGDVRTSAALDVAIAAARSAHREGRPHAAVLALRDARTHSALPWLTARLAGAWLDIGRPREALALYTTVLEGNPDDVDALIGRAAAWSALGRLLLAAETLEADFDRIGDARLGLALADVQTRRGTYAAAARTLARVEVVPSPTAPVRRTLPALPLPSGREVPAAAEPLSELGGNRLADARATLAVHRAVRGSAGVLSLARGGAPGTAQIGALALPVEATTPPIGPVRVRVQVAPIRLYADTGTDDGVAATVGVLTPEGRRVSGNVHLGTSPIGFDGGVYPTWSARLTLRPARSLGVAFETVRAPRVDSRASWASEVYAPTGQRYGRASELSLGASLSWSTPTTNIGASGRTGWVEGIGVPPNPFGEGVFWAERRAEGERFGGTLSASGVAQAYTRRDDAFLPGQGAYFSPPLHLAGLAWADGHVRIGPARLCAGVGGGPRYLGGEPTPFASAGLGAVGTARLGAGVRVSERLSLSVDARGQLVSDGWHQLGAFGLLSWGVPAAPGDLRSSATLAAAGLALPSTGDACPVP